MTKDYLPFPDDRPRHTPEYPRNVETPVTGCFNAGVAQWLIANGTAPPSYKASQGARVGRRGVINIDTADTVWIGGICTTLIRGGALL